MSNMNTLNLEYALDKIRSVKDGIMKRSMDREKYIQLCNCEKDILGAMDVINMINSGDFDKYYNE